MEAVIFLISLAITFSYILNLTCLLYGIAKNLTHNELFEPEKQAHLWVKVDYIPDRKILTRRYNNPNDKGLKQNII
jgi:hypothetical protein